MAAPYRRNVIAGLAGLTAFGSGFQALINSWDFQGKVKTHLDKLRSGAEAATDPKPEPTPEVF